MGICKSLPASTEDLPTMDSSGHKQTEIVIKEDTSPIYDENKIIVIQALYRGHKVRKSLMTTLHSPETSAPTQVEQSKFCFDPNQLNTYDQSSILMKNGAIYKGEWKDGKANGKGQYQFQDRFYVEGTWASNELQGEAVYVNGTEKYKGQWLDSMFHGIGEYVYSDGRIYQGEWKKGLQHGMGKEIYKDKSTYEGKFKEGMKYGLGIMRLADGCVYEGEFENDQFHGYGSFIWPDRKKIFEGYWKNGTKHGNGTMKWGDGMRQILIQLIFKVESILVNIQKDLNMDMEKCNIVMVAVIRDNGRMDYKMEWEYLQTRKGMKKKDSGLKENQRNGFELLQSFDFQSLLLLLYFD
ncbi:unnamed protein product [Paramecium primaurelia]|uniref:MORN repeat protein n=1 Tax=Paramecium primaurelia TaxID=5886 RepID=A0A8S1MSI9_PARPR|nr:unnamed protein product [Paramecium primaurelia]